MKKLREPKIKNKYNLKPKDISNLKILDRTQIKEPLFWRNDVIQAWCISKDIGSQKDIYYGSSNSVWLGIYDENAKSYRDKIRYYCTCYGDMCSYNFKEFFNYKEIENENDLTTQEFLLSTINNLIDNKILGLPQ